MFQVRERWSRTERRKRFGAVGFTLVEVLIVIAIVAILVSILLPTLSGTRTAARRAATSSMLNEVGSAIKLFKNEKDRHPGVHKPDQMGHPDNMNRYGVTFIENAIIDLMGGKVAAGTPDPDGVLIRMTVIGNDPTQVAMVNPNLIGAREGPGYLSLGRNVLYAVSGQYHGGNPQGRVDKLPDIVDPFGNPIMMWPKNMTAGRTARFAMVQAPMAAGPGVQRAWFYWAGNAGYLRAHNLGTQRVNQSGLSVLGRLADNTANIGYPQASDQDLVISMAALLGHPNLSRPSDESVGGVTLEPTAPLADVILHSAGADGVYLGNDYRRLRQQAHQRAVYQREGEIPQRSMPIDRFDDLIVPSG